MAPAKLAYAEILWDVPRCSCEHEGCNFQGVVLLALFATREPASTKNFEYVPVSDDGVAATIVNWLSSQGSESFCIVGRDFDGEDGVHELVYRDGAWTTPAGQPVEDWEVSGFLLP